MRKVSVIIISLCIFNIMLSSVSAAQPKVEKTETVYVNLDYYGEVEQINVSNSCIINGQEEIIDYGRYLELSNLTNRLSPIKTDDGIKWNVSGEKFFNYIGKVDNSMKKDIPWNIDISYKLNGVTSTPEELLGKAGLVKVTVDINANKEANEYYKNNYILEVTGTYSLNDYLSVESNEAMFIMTGKSKTLMFIVLPGQSTTLNIELGTEDFEMDSLTFAMVPLQGELAQKVEDLVKDKKDFEQAIKELNKATDNILNTLGQMPSGLSKITDGLQDLQNGTDEIYNISDLRDEDIRNLKESAINTKAILELMEKDLSNAKASAEDLNTMLEDIQKESKKALDIMGDIEENLEELEDSIDNIPNVIGNVKDTLKTTQSLIKNTINLLETQENSTNIDTDEIANNLTQIATAAYTILGVTPTDFAQMSSSEKMGLVTSNEKGKALEILSNLGEVQGILSEIEGLSSGAISSTSSLTTNLSSLKKHINEMDSYLSQRDAKELKDCLYNLEHLFNSITKMTNILDKNLNKYLESKDNIIVAIDNINNLLIEIENVEDVTISMLNNLQTILNVIDTKIYVGASKMTSGLIETTNRLGIVTSQSNSIKMAKDKAKDVIKNRWDSIEDETTIFELDSNAKVVSFSSNKNESPDKVQFMLKSKEIKSVNFEVEDLEEEKVDNESFWTRFIGILKSMFSWIFKSEDK